MDRRLGLLLLGLLGCGEVNRSFSRDAGRTPAMDVADAGPVGPCEPGRIYCEGVGVSYRCDSSGQMTARTMCTGAESTCAPGLGCRVCMPETTRCDPAMPNRTQRCRGDGSGWDNGAVCEGSGAFCSAGVCQDRCSAASVGRSYLGCDYWPVTLPNALLDPSFSFAVVLSNPQTYEVTAEISGGGLTMPRRVTLGAGAIEVVRLPWVVPVVQLDPNCVRVGDRCVGVDPARSSLARGGAYHVRSDGPIAAYQFNPLTFQEGTRFSYTNDASLLLPQGVLTQRYTVMTWPNQSAMGETSGGFAAIVATTGESTSVTVRAAGAVKAGDGVASIAAGQTRTFTLNEGDVLTLVGDGPGDLTGSTIEASAPVAVYVGHDCTQVPFGRVACDHLEEQLLPNETWGQDYIVSHLRDRGTMQPAVVRVLSRADGNALTFDPPVFRDQTLNNGAVIEFETTRHFRVTGTGAFLVSQFMQGQGPSNPFSTDGAGDPAMVIEVPVQQFRTRYDFYVPSTYPRNFINIVVPAGASVLLDEQPVRGSMETVGEFVVYTLPIEAGAHRMRSLDNRGFGIKVYGIARYTSYTYPGGLDLQLIAPG